jgi:hypothetical protein
MSSNNIKYNTTLKANSTVVNFANFFKTHHFYSLKLLFVANYTYGERFEDIEYILYLT